MSSAHLRLVAISVGIVALLGCESDDPTKPEYWISQLKSTQRANAIQKIGAMGSAGGEQAKVAHAVIPHLLRLYNADKNRGDIVPTLVQMKATGPEVTSLMLQAIIDANEMAAAAAAADYLGEAGAKEHVRDLLAVLDTEMDDQVKAASLRSVAKFADPSTVDDLIRVLDRPVDSQWIHLNALACKALGEIGAPAADKALPHLVKGIFLRDKFSRMSFRDCSVALLKFGAAAGPALTAAVDGSDEELVKWSQAQGHVVGLLSEEASKVIGLLGYKPAVGALVKELVVHNSPPPSYNAKKQQIWASIEAS